MENVMKKKEKKRSKITWGEGRQELKKKKKKKIIQDRNSTIA